VPSKESPRRIGGIEKEMNGDPLEYWSMKHNDGHLSNMTLQRANSSESGYDPNCPFCNPEIMKEIKEEL